MISPVMMEVERWCAWAICSSLSRKAACAWSLMLPSRANSLRFSSLLRMRRLSV